MRSWDNLAVALLLMLAVITALGMNIVQVTSAVVTIDEVSEEAVDDNNNSLYDTLVIQVNCTNFTGGLGVTDQCWVNGTLYDGYGAEIGSTSDEVWSWNFLLKNGATLEFEGRDIQEHGVDGPYRVEIEIIRRSNLSVDDNLTYYTEPYYAEQFEIDMPPESNIIDGSQSIFGDIVSLEWEAWDDYHLERIDLHASSSPDNSEWTPFSYVGSTPANGKHDANNTYYQFPSEGWYRFYTIAVDDAGNEEAPPEIADTVIHYDITRPNVTGHYPNGTVVHVGTLITIEFDETMNATSAEGAFTLEGNGTDASTNGTFSWDGSTMTWIPDVPLEANTTYWMNVSTGARDLVGNQLFENFSANFTTGCEDLQPPAVEVTNVNLAATGVPVSTNLVLAFSETMNRSSVSEALSITYSGANPVTRSTSWDGNDLIVDFAGDLLFETKYTLVLNGSIAMDVSGNLLDGNGSGTPGSDYVFYFTTRKADITPPTVVSTSPESGVADQPLAISFTIVFSEAMEQNTFTSGLMLPEGAELQDVIWSGDSTTVRFNVTGLEYGTNYTLTLDSNIVTDTSENELDGDGNGSPGGEYSIAFRTMSGIGSISGTVMDEDGAPVENATVVVKDQEGSIVATNSSDGEGHYYIEVLTGTYTVTIGGDGFDDVLLENITITPGQGHTHDVVLEEKEEGVDIGASHMAWIVGSTIMLLVLIIFLAGIMVSRRRPPEGDGSEPGPEGEIVGERPGGGAGANAPARDGGEGDKREPEG